MPIEEYPTRAEITPEQVPYVFQPKSFLVWNKIKELIAGGNATLYYARYELYTQYEVQFKGEAEYTPLRNFGIDDGLLIKG